MSKEFIIPTNPADLKKIKDAVKLASDCKVRIDAENDELKAIADTLHEELEIPRAVFNRLVRVYHKQTYDKEVVENDTFEEFYEKVMA